LLANLGKPKPEYIKSLDNILFGFGLSKLGSEGSGENEEETGEVGGS
jgi:hypothetical protein